MRLEVRGVTNMVPQSAHSSSLPDPPQLSLGVLFGDTHLLVSLLLSFR